MPLQRPSADRPDLRYQRCPTSPNARTESVSSQPLSRRSSVFSDLATVFRKNTGSRSIQQYHPPPRKQSTWVEWGGVPPAAQVTLERKRDEVGDGDENEDEEETDRPLSKAHLLSKIRQKKEVINKLRCQPWSMQRKRRTLRLAQKYLEQHESRVSCGHLYKEELRKRWHWFVRWCSNFVSNIVPWESKIKRIESHFGSVVSSYFTFLRWVIFMNASITLLILSFVVIPEVISDLTADGARRERTRTRKVMPPQERAHADEFTVVWHWGGYLRWSPLFYGYYSDVDVPYSLPIAYFLAILAVFAFSFFIILKKMAANASTNKMTGSKASRAVHLQLASVHRMGLFGRRETASNAIMAGVIKLRELIAETRVQKEEKFECLRFTLRVFANMVILLMLAFSIYCISFAVQSSQTIENKGNLLTKSQVPAVVSTITHVFPMIFDLIGRIEAYHPRTAHRAHLARVLVLYVLNYLTLIIALLEKLDSIRESKGMLETEPVLTLVDKAKRELSVPGPRSYTFFSRNFTNLRQMRAALEGRESPSWTQPWPRSSVAPTLPTTSRTAAVTVDGEDVEVQSQFGPVGVNHAKALMRNATPAPTSKRYETKRLGPTVLPAYPTPLPPPTQDLPTYREQEYGPHWNLDRAIAQQKIRPPAGRKPPPLPVGSGQSRDRSSTQAARNGTQRPRIVAESLHSDQICWETLIGQEIVRLVTVDLYITIASILIIDFFRALWVRHCSSWWCWNIEETFPEYGEFKVAENVLHIVNNQGMIWLGLFFAPLLPAINNLKLIAFLYIRAWAVMSSNVPAKEIFRASRQVLIRTNSNFFLMILLLWLLLCTLPVGYVIASRRPSSNCGPFAGQDHFYQVITTLLEDKIDKNVLRWIKVIASPGVVIPILLLLVLIIYFLVSLVRGLREANSDLQQQLVHERTEEKKKIFELAGGGVKKKPGFGRNGKLQPKKPGQVLPEIEQKRREPWRAHHGTENTLSLCPTDEPPSSLNSPASQLSPPSTRKKSARDQFDLSPSRKQTLGSLNEVDGETHVDHRKTSREVPTIMSRSMPVSHSNQTAKLEDWNEDARSEQSVKSAVPELSTPDELRNIMAPLMDLSLKNTPSAVSLAAFPKDSSPVTVIFGSQASGSRRSSNRESLISLYDNNRSLTEDVPQRSSVSKVLRSVESAGLPPMPSTSIGATPAQEGPHSMALYSREPRRVGNYSVMTASTSSAPPPLPKHGQPPKGLPSKSATQSRNQLAGGQKVEVNSVTDQFVPWPSIDQVKAQRARLVSRSQPKSPIKTSTSYDSSALRGRSPSPLKFKEKRDSSPEESSSAHPRRFRISVSPTRKVHSDDLEEATSSRPPPATRPRYIIKQRILPGSTISMASSRLTESSFPSKPSTPVAPRATIDEMDSPPHETPTPFR
ncbi:TMC domain-containing protein [Aphelenchoides fujianensis]|nr:TMC domain-containing protein [Aphelenchoides fujianensis]